MKRVKIEENEEKNLNTLFEVEYNKKNKIEKADNMMSAFKVNYVIHLKRLAYLEELTVLRLSHNVRLFDDKQHLYGLFLHL